MKKAILILTILFAFTACKKEHLIAPQTITYHLTGEGAYAEIYSNHLKRGIQYDVDSTDLIISEEVNPGDSLSVFMMSSWYYPSHLTIRLGGRIIADGTPDSTGYLYYHGILTASYFYK